MRYKEAIVAQIYTCEWCGKPFTQKHAPKGHPFCSRACSTKHAWAEKKARGAKRGLDRATEMTRIGNRIGQMARDAGMSRKAFGLMVRTIMRIAEMEYTVGGRTDGHNTAAPSVEA